MNWLNPQSFAVSAVVAPWLAVVVLPLVLPLVHRNRSGEYIANGVSLQLDRFVVGLHLRLWWWRFSVRRFDSYDLGVYWKFQGRVHPAATWRGDQDVTSARMLDWAR